jgi:transposase
MPQLPTPLRESNANSRISNTELSPYLRGIIIGLAHAGQTPTQIQNALSLPESTIRTTIQRDKTRNNGESKPRSGRPVCYSVYDERRILRIVRKEPKITYKELKIQLGIDISNTTLTRILHKYGIAKWRAAKRPFLTQIIATKRLEFALKY